MSTEKKEAGISFKLVDTTEKPSRTYRKGSKYDPILDAFITSNRTLVGLEIEKDGNYMRTQLVKRVNARKLGVIVSVVNDTVYLEVGTPNIKKKANKGKKLKVAVPSA